MPDKRPWLLLGELNSGGQLGHPGGISDWLIKCQQTAQEGIGLNPLICFSTVLNSIAV